MVIAEQFIDGAGVHRGDRSASEALPLIRIEAPRGYYDYQTSTSPTTRSTICPCGLPAKKEEELQALALQAFRALGCRGWGRVDLMLDSADGRACWK